MLLEGKLSKKYLVNANNITNYYKNIISNYNKSKHYWIDDINDKELKYNLNKLRNSPDIINVIKKNNKGNVVIPVHKNDEVYIGVDPSKKSGSDNVLVNCHYDGPFKFFPNKGMKFLRCILSISDNNTVYTTIEDKKSMLSTLDFNIINYNTDYHCVNGTIPKGKIRIILKLHFLVKEPSVSKCWENYYISINYHWTRLSRNLFLISQEPKNIFEYIISYIVIYTTKLYTVIRIVDIKLIILIIVLLILLYYYKKLSSK